MNGGCGKIREEVLSAYVDGMADGATLRAIAAHLLDCDACKALVADFRHQQGLLRQLKAEPLSAPPEFWANAYRVARLSKSRGSQSARPRFGFSWSVPQFAGIALAAVVGAVIGSQVQFGRVDITSVPVSRQAGPSLDVSTLVRAHADYASQQPLADNAHLTMVLSDASAQGSPSDGLLAADAPTLGSVMNASATSD